MNRSSETDVRIWFDCTSTLRDGYNTGIQRVVRNLIRSGPQAGSKLGVVAAPVIHFEGQWYRPGRRLLAAADRRLDAKFGPSPKEASPPLWRSTLRRLRQATVPRPIYRFVSTQSDRLLRRLRCRRAALRPGDLLVLPDVIWNQPEPPPLEAARRAGARIGLVSYDLIPLRFPQYQAPEFAELFGEWLQATLPQIDFCVAISRAARVEIVEYLRAAGSQYERLRGRIGWFPLGVQLDKLRASAPVRDALRRVFERSDAAPPFLFVSTLEPRKNHAALLDAFERRAAADPRTQLCLIGRRGWMCDALVERIVRHPAYGERLHWFADLNDDELDYAYRRARACVFPSFAEGFGLPVVEALHYGLPVLASDLPAHREIAGEFCQFFDPRDVDRLTELLAAFDGAGRLPPVRPASEFRATPWDESCSALWRECLRRAAPQVSGGEAEEDDGW